MATPDKGALARQIGADPRVQAYIAQRQRGSIPVELNAQTLAQFGYQVPSDWHYRSAAGRLPAHLYDDHDKWDDVLMAAGGGILSGGLIDVIQNPAQDAAGSVNEAGVYTDPRFDGAQSPYPPGGVPSGGTRPPSSVPGGEDAGSIMDKLKGGLTDPNNLAGLAALVPLLTQAFSGTPDNPYGNTAQLNDEVSKSLALQRQRVEQAQPVYDTLVNMSYGSTPTRYRGAPPVGYPDTATTAPAGPYQYKGPRFG